MLDLLAIVLLVAWLLAFAASSTMGGYANDVLVIALILVVARPFRRRPPI
jgi:Family of unknown function (DUF5670)